MSRLIDAEHFEQMLIDLIDHGDHKNAYVHHAYKMRNVAINECRKMLWEEPTLDAVPVVRCKDCRYRNWETNGCDRNPCVKPWWEDDYCSYGEE